MKFNKKCLFVSLGEVIFLFQLNKIVESEIKAVTLKAQKWMCGFREQGEMCDMRRISNCPTIYEAFISVPKNN